MSILLLFVLPAALALWFWNKIVFFFQTRMLPWVRSHIGNSAADLLTNLIMFADNAATCVRRTIRKGYRWLCENILGMKTKYSQDNASTVIRTTTTFVKNEDGTYTEVISTEEILRDDVPANARIEILKGRTEPVEIDDLNELKTKIKKRAEEEEIELEAAA
ncbi:MAG: hypothetical protein J6K20_08775 [Thermoguttaceae bacterium]|nr:hypothetical protein [Thermoguttaceae bacterium]